MRHAQAGTKLRKVWRVQVNVAVATAVNVVLNVFDDAVTAVVHQQHHQVGALLHGTGQLAHVQHEAAITRKHDSFALKAVFVVSNGHANCHCQALPNAAAQRMHASARVVQHWRAIAPHAVAQRDVAHPPNAWAGLLFNRVFKRQVRAQRVVYRLSRFSPRCLHVCYQSSVDLHLTFQNIGQRIQRGGCVALHKIVAAVAPVVR